MPMHEVAPSAVCIADIPPSSFVIPSVSDRGQVLVSDIFAYFRLFWCQNMHKCALVCADLYVCNEIF